MSRDHNRPASAPSNRLGAYGLHIAGLAAAEWMQCVDADAPTLRVDVRQVQGDHRHARPSEVSADHADVRLVGGGRLRMSRGVLRAEFGFVDTPAPADLLHPYLAPAAALAQLWLGREALHAGAFVTRAGAVLLLAEKEGGKSTTLAVLADRHGVPVITDDLAVIDGGAVLAGPRCIDLRPTTGVAPLGAEGARLVRGAERLRMPLEPVPVTIPIHAVVWLEWESALSIEQVPLGSRLPALLRQRMYGAVVPADEVELLNLAALPAIRLGRPRGQAGLDEACTALAGYFG